MPFADINNARLWYETRGEGPPLLLHHGYTACRDNWMPVANRLQDRFNVILMECRGAGASEHTRSGYSLRQLADDVIGILDHLSLNQVAFAGHSMGGGIGYLLGLENAQRLSHLILMAPIPADGTTRPDAELRAQRLGERARKDRAAIFARYTEQRFRPDVETDQWFESRVDNVLGVSDGHFEGMADAMSQLSVGDRLGNLHTPSLMIAGAADGLLPANLHDFQRMPNATLEVLSRAGHEVAIHEPDAVANSIANFLTLGICRPPG